MKEVNENFGQLSRAGFMSGLPFYGVKGDFNFTLGRSKFTPGISVKQVPLSDLSVKGDPGFSDFDMSVNKLKTYFRPGHRVRGILVNSQLESENGKMVVGRLHKIQPDYSNQNIRVWITDPKTLQIKEIYPETIERIYESYRALSFDQFINS